MSPLGPDRRHTGQGSQREEAGLLTEQDSVGFPVFSILSCPGVFCGFRTADSDFPPPHSPLATCYVPRIRPNREEEEKGAKDILALRHPCNRLDVQRVPGEEGRNECAAPGGACHA